MVMREFQQRIKAQKVLEQEVQRGEVQTAVAAYASNYSVLEISLLNDVNAIRALPTLESRAKYKRKHFLPKWLPFVEEYLTKGEVYQNDYFIYCIVYLFDVGDFDKALQFADIAIQQKQSMPQHFNSPLPVFVANQIYDWTSKTATQGQSVEPYFSQVFQKVATIWQLQEVITAKWLKMAAALLLRNQNGEVKASEIDDPEALLLAITLCFRAFQLNHKAGVKSMIERCIMRLNSLEKVGKYQPEQLPPLPSLGSEAIKLDVAKIVEKLRAGQVLIDETGQADNV